MEDIDDKCFLVIIGSPGLCPDCGHTIDGVDPEFCQNCNPNNDEPNIKTEPNALLDLITELNSNAIKAEDITENLYSENDDVIVEYIFEGEDSAENNWEGGTIDIDNFVECTLEEESLGAEILDKRPETMDEIIERVLKLKDSKRRDKRLKIKCDICKKHFKTITILKSHIVKHKDDKPFICNYCAKGFKDNGTLKRHLVTHTAEKSYACNYCNKYFSRKDNLHTHMRLHTGQNLFYCDHCQKSYIHKTKLEAHISVIHMGIKQYKCELCAAEFLKKESLRSHMRWHTGEKPYPCKLCDECFISDFALQKHLVVHADNKPFVCKYCGMGCSNIEALKKHKKLHVVDRPYQCGNCFKCFTLEIDLKEHLDEHQYSLNRCKGPYGCTLCNKIFNRKWDLNLHLRIHNRKKKIKEKIACKECVQTFSSKQCLVRHEMQCHSGLRPHICGVCNRSFARRDAFVVHNRTHAKDRPYVCDVCSCGFAQLGDLKRHMSRMHKIKR